VLHDQGAGHVAARRGLVMVGGGAGGVGGVEVLVLDLTA